MEINVIMAFDTPFFLILLIKNRYRPNYSTSRNDFFLQPMTLFRAGGRRLPSGLPHHVPGLQPDLLANVPQFTTRSVKTTSGHSDILTF